MRSIRQYSITPIGFLVGSIPEPRVHPVTGFGFELAAHLVRDIPVLDEKRFSKFISEFEHLAAVPFDNVYKLTRHKVYLAATRLESTIVWSLVVRDGDTGETLYTTRLASDRKPGMFDTRATLLDEMLGGSEAMGNRRYWRVERDASWACRRGAAVVEELATGLHPYLYSLVCIAAGVAAARLYTAHPHAIIAVRGYTPRTLIETVYRVVYDYPELGIEALCPTRTICRAVRRLAATGGHGMVYGRTDLLRLARQV